MSFTSFTSMYIAWAAYDSSCECTSVHTAVSFKHLLGRLQYHPHRNAIAFFHPSSPSRALSFSSPPLLSHTRTHADDGVHTVLREPITTLCFQVLFVNGIFTGADESGAAPASVSTQPPHRGNVPIPFLSSPPFGVSLSHFLSVAAST